MITRLLAVGRLKERYFQDAAAEYVKRLRPYCRLQTVEFKTDHALAAGVHDGEHLIVLDERGRDITSIDFSNLIGTHQQHGGGAALAFAIGGPDGHCAAVRERANALLCFGRMTVGHRLIRLVLLEQLYRAHRILRGEPYHR